ncbi:MAG TPA: Ig-like domain-containing protein, partial [Longimicrobium sp.]|nr:Ig-like domain-containing protein [Longimicrobium sp.]
VDATGLATGVDAGTVTITASIGYAQGTATLTVIQPNTPPVANADTFQAIGNVTIPVAAPGVLANDTDTETPGGLSVVAETVTTANGGTAVLAADGSFTYLSPAGFLGTDSFQYTVTDGSLTATGTVTVTVPNRVWYVSNAGAAPGDGRDASPFTALASAEGASAAGETIFVLYGNGTTAGYDAGITLKAGQALTGQGVPADVTATVNGQTVVLLEAGNAPTVTNAAAGTTIQLATGNTVQGLNVNSTAGAGIGGSAFGTFTAGSVNVAAIGGPSLDLQNGTVAATFATLSSANSAGAGLRLVNVSGTLTAPAGVVSGAAGAGVEISGGNADVTYGGSISGSGTRAAQVTGRTGGALVLSGDITDTNGGILVQNNSGGTIAFNGGSKSLATGSNSGVTLANNGGATVSFGGGGLAITTSGATGFSATGGGTVNVTGAGNTIASSGATALSVVNTDIGASGLSFQSISASGAVNGIVLDNTGATNGLQVTGSGAAGSGGTITGMSGDGVSLSNASNVRLAWMSVTGNLGSGIYASGVSGVRVEDSSVLNNADNAAADEAGIRFDNVTGTSAIENTTVAGSVEDNARVVNSAGSLALTVSGSTFRDNNTTTGQHGLRLVAEGAANMGVQVQNSSFLRNRSTGIEASTTGSGVLSVTVQGGALQQNSLGVNIAHGSAGALTFGVLNVGTITGHTSSPINVNRLATAGAASTFSGTISGNTIGAVGVTNSGATSGSGVRVVSNGASGAVTVAITNNIIREVSTRGVDIIARDGGSTINATVTGNTVTLTNPISLEGIRLDAGALTTDTVKICAAISGNSATTAGASAPIRVRQRFAGTTFQLAGYAGSPTDMSAVASFLTSTNTVASALADFGGAGFIGVPSCPTP